MQTPSDPAPFLFSRIATLSFLKIVSVEVRIQYYFVLLSGTPHSGQTTTYFIYKVPPIFPAPTWHRHSYYDSIDAIPYAVLYIPMTSDFSGILKG